MKRIGKILLVVLAVLLVVLLVGPFLIPIRPLEGLQSPQELAPENSRFLTLPYTGTDGLDIHYRLEGDGEPTFILLHGFASSLFTWDEVFDFFAAQGRTLAYDRPPFGLSERLIDGDWTGPNPYTPDAAVEQLIDMMNEQNIDQAVLVGNSAGGTLAMRTALAYPERVYGLILVSPAVYAGGGAPPFIQPLLGTPQLQRIGPLISRSFLSLGDSLENQSFHDPSRVTAEQKAKARLGLQVENWDKALWAFTTASQESDLVERLGEITVPTLVITGDDDRIVPTEQSLRLAEELPNARLALLANCGHVPQEECDEDFLAAVSLWLLGAE